MRRRIRRKIHEKSNYVGNQYPETRVVKRTGYKKRTNYVTTGMYVRDNDSVGVQGVAAVRTNRRESGQVNRRQHCVRARKRVVQKYFGFLSSGNGKGKKPRKRHDNKFTIDKLCRR